MANTRTQHTNSYVMKMKAVSIIVVIALIFLVRTTGALQQELIESNGDVVIVNGGLNTRSTNLNNDSRSQNGSGDTSTSSNPANNANTSISGTGNASSSSGTSNAMPGTGTATTSDGSSGGDSSSNGGTIEPSTSPVVLYRDGTYTADGSYDTPAGSQKIGITLVLSGGIVVDTNAVRKATNPTSKTYQNDFIANYKSQVVGKSLKDLNLGKVSGSSLTPIGFNNVAENIRQQAS